MLELEKTPGGHMAEKYHMIDYIHEGPEALRKTLVENEEKLLRFVDRCHVHGINRLVVTGLGSSFAAAKMAEPIFRSACPLPVMMVNSEEAVYYSRNWFGPESLVVSISRSGERGSAVEVQKMIRDAGGLGLAVTSRSDNLLAEYAGETFVTQEGPEISFPKTKSVLACAGILMRLALGFGDRKDPQIIEWLERLRKIPDIVEENINILEPAIKELLPEITAHRMLNVVGTGSNHGLALDAAVKVQESSFVTTRGDSTAGLFHGPVGALNKYWLVLALVTPADREVSAELLKQVRTFKAHSLCVQDPLVDMGKNADFTISLSSSEDIRLAALAYMPAVQLLAYYWTTARGMNPDKPSSMESLMDAMVPPGRSEAEFKQEEE